MNCPSCGTENSPGARFCRSCGVAFAPQEGMDDQGVSMGYGGAMPGAYAAPQYAGFWIRVVAYIIDAIILGIVGGIIGAVLGGILGNGGLVVIQLIGIAIGIAYFAYFESSERQATVGKMALGLKVTDTEGRRITTGKAVGRYFAKIVSGIILLIGFIMVAFDSRKQGLHDKIVNTLVVKAR